MQCYQYHCKFCKAISKRTNFKRVLAIFYRFTKKKKIDFWTDKEFSFIDVKDSFIFDVRLFRYTTERYDFLLRGLHI